MQGKKTLSNPSAKRAFNSADDMETYRGFDDYESNYL